MEKLLNIEKRVKVILEKEPGARRDDMYLYYLYCTRYGVLNERAFVKLFRSKGFRKEQGLAVFESVSRARRKLQQENEYLRPPKEVQDARTNEQGEYIRYAINDSRKGTFRKFLDNND